MAHGKKSIQLWSLNRLATFDICISNISSFGKSKNDYSFETKGLARDFVVECQCPSNVNVTHDAWMFVVNENLTDENE